MSQPSIPPGAGTGMALERQELAVRVFQRVEISDRLLALMSHEELAIAAQQHPPPAGLRYQEVLWARLRPEVERTLRYRFANLVWKSRLENADFVGESFLVLREAIKNFDPQRKRPFWPYYLTGLLRHFINLSNRSRGIELQEAAELLEDTHSDPRVFDIFTERDLMEDLFPTNVKHRDLKLIIFRLHEFEGMTISDLSKRHGKSIGTIHGWLEEVRSRLKRALQEPE